MVCFVNTDCFPVLQEFRPLLVAFVLCQPLLLDLSVQSSVQLTIFVLSLHSTTKHCFNQYQRFLADRTIGRAFGTVCRLSVCLSVCNVLYCGKMVRPSEKVSEGVNRKPGSKSSFLGSPPYFYFRFHRYGHQDGRFCLIFARIGLMGLSVVGSEIPQ